MGPRGLTFSACHKVSIAEGKKGTRTKNLSRHHQQLRNGHLRDLEKQSCLDDWGE
jgi:hypothetical protein